MNSYEVLRESKSWLKEILLDISRGRLCVQEEGNYFYVISHLSGLCLGFTVELFQERGKENEVIVRIFDNNIFLSDSRYDSTGGSFANIERVDFQRLCRSSGLFEKELIFQRSNDSKKPSFLEEALLYTMEIAFPSSDGQSFLSKIDFLKEILSGLGGNSFIEGGVEFSIPVEVVLQKEASLSRT